jgi:translation initiation factor IF-1
MSSATKKRFVAKHLDVELILPRENELVGRVIAARGRDLFEVIDANGQQYLASMPTRFRT